MYMNAITVNYAEVGDDHLPISFGFGSEISFAGQTVYNSTITEIPGTSCIILQGQDIGTTNIIVSSESGTNRLLSGFTLGLTSWIEHIIPNINDKDTTYIFYNSSDGYYYKMVENDQGKPVQEKYAPYAYLKAVQNNAKYPYCEAIIETPVELQISDGKVNAIINNKSVQIAEMKSSLVVELENADGTLNKQTIKQNEYSINTSIYNLNGIVWTRDDKTVTSWLLDNNKIVKSDMSVSRWTKTIKLLAGKNVVTIPRNKSTIKVNFTFKDMPSFEWGGAYHNGFESSTMSSNTLTLYNVRQDSSKNLTTFFTGSEAIWFNLSTIDNLPGSGTFNVDISIPTPSVTDTIKFTGWIDGKLEQGKSIPDNKHGILPETYTIDKMNTESLSRVDIKIDNKATSLLSYINNSTQFKRHRQITHIQQSSTGSTSSSTTTIDDTKAPSTSSNSSGGKDIYIYTKDNNENKIFNVTAHYTSIPAVVSVTNPSDTAAANSNQVVLFEGAYYVADTNMKSLVESLVSGVTVTVQKEIVRNDAWQITTFQKYYKMDTTTTEDGTDTAYTAKRARITISGISSQVTSVKSSDSNLTAQLTNQALSGTDISITIHYIVPDGYSLLNTSHQLTLDVQSTIPASDWDKKDTYKFFN